jgi:hypothetical protein
VASSFLKSHHIFPTVPKPVENHIALHTLVLLADLRGQLHGRGQLHHLRRDCYFDPLRTSRLALDEPFMLPNSHGALGLRGFELAYAGIDAIVLKQSGERTAFTGRYQMARDVCASRHTSSTRKASLDWTSCRNGALVLRNCPALIGAAPEPR